MLTRFTREQAMDLSEITELEWTSPIPINLPPFEQTLARGLQNLEVRELNPFTRLGHLPNSDMHVVVEIASRAQMELADDDNTRKLHLAQAPSFGARLRWFR